MKILVFQLTDTIKNFAFPPKLLRSRTELIELCMRTCRELNSLKPLERQSVDLETVVLMIGKMSRLFFFTEKKYISISIPLTFNIIENNPPVFHGKQCEIDAEMWSWLIQRLNTDKESLLNQEDYYEFILRCEALGINFDEIFKSFEDSDYGYLRYDIDVKAAREAKEKGRPHHHPEHHCDIHLNPSATFKTGLIRKINPIEFINIVDNEQDRWYTVSSAYLIGRKILKP